MKLKYAASRTFGEDFFAAVNSQATARYFITRIVIEALKVDPASITPGGHFNQEADIINPYDNNLGMNLAFTMVTKTWDRNAPEFIKALGAMMSFSEKLAHKFGPVWKNEGDPLVHILCVLALDGEVDMPWGKKERLLDQKWEKWVYPGHRGKIVEHPPVYAYHPNEFEF